MTPSPRCIACFLIELANGIIGNIVHGMTEGYTGYLQFSSGINEGRSTAEMTDVNEAFCFHGNRRPAPTLI